MSYMQSEGLSQDTKSNTDTVIIRQTTLFMKRFLDIIISMIAIIILSPVFIVLLVMIKRDSEGPAIFKQKRVGINGKEFTIFKFRTMVQNAENMKKLEVNPDNIGDFVFQSKNDNRVTKLGAFLRKSSLDELPQLFNVFIGDMSVVGPRPEIHQIADLYNDEQKQRLLVKPGITGLAQVMGRGELSVGKTIEYDREYIRNLSLRQDLNIIVRTFKVVVSKKGAY